MQILLLLSAFLSAITGGLSTGRADAAPLGQAEAQLVAVAPAQRAAPAVIVRPVPHCPRHHAVGAVIDAPQVTVHAAPLAHICLIE